MTTSLAKRDPVQEVVSTIDRPEFQTQLRDVLPAGVSLEKFTRTTKLAVQMNPDIVGADRRSLFLAMVQCAASGLLPDGRESALVTVKVRGKENVAWWPMIGGLRKKAAEHGITLAASVVYEHDTFSYSTMPPAVEHKPTPLGQDKGQILGAFAVALDPTGRVICPPVVMSREEIDKVKAGSRSASSEYSPWVKWYDRMACKTVARRLFSEMPLANQARDELEAALQDVVPGEVTEASAPVPALANLPAVDLADDEDEVWEQTTADGLDDVPFGEDD